MYTSESVQLLDIHLTLSEFVVHGQGNKYNMAECVTLIFST